MASHELPEARMKAVALTDTNNQPSRIRYQEIGPYGKKAAFGSVEHTEGESVLASKTILLESGKGIEIQTQRLAIEGNEGSGKRFAVGTVFVDPTTDRGVIFQILQSPMLTTMYYAFQQETNVIRNLFKSKPTNSQLIEEIPTTSVDRSYNVITAKPGMRADVLLSQLRNRKTDILIPQEISFIQLYLYNKAQTSLNELHDRGFIMGKGDGWDGLPHAHAGNIQVDENMNAWLIDYTNAKRDPMFLRSEEQRTRDTDTLFATFLPTQYRKGLGMELTSIDDARVVQKKLTTLIINQLNTVDKIEAFSDSIGLSLTDEQRKKLQETTDIAGAQQDLQEYAKAKNTDIAGAYAIHLREKFHSTLIAAIMDGLKIQVTQKDLQVIKEGIKDVVIATPTIQYNKSATEITDQLNQELAEKTQAELLRQAQEAKKSRFLKIFDRMLHKIME